MKDFSLLDFSSVSKQKKNSHGIDVLITFCCILRVCMFFFSYLVCRLRKTTKIEHKIMTKEEKKIWLSAAVATVATTLLYFTK